MFEPGISNGRELVPPGRALRTILGPSARCAARLCREACLVLAGQQVAVIPSMSEMLASTTEGYDIGQGTIRTNKETQCPGLSSVPAPWTSDPFPGFLGKGLLHGPLMRSLQFRRMPFQEDSLLASRPRSQGAGHVRAAHVEHPVRAPLQAKATPSQERQSCGGDGPRWFWPTTFVPLGSRCLRQRPSELPIERQVS